jgi:hypothetical protein
MTPAKSNCLSVSSQTKEIFQKKYEV